MDNHIGACIHERRILLGLTQQQLAEMIGVTHQQVYKFEHGLNRVSAGQCEFARSLDVPITYFYEGVDEMKSRRVVQHERMMLEIAQLRRYPEQEAPGRAQPNHARSRGALSARPVSPVQRILFAGVAVICSTPRSARR
jgi:transcriptional regulator with XRE-family HTH domain